MSRTLSLVCVVTVVVVERYKKNFAAFGDNKEKNKAFFSRFFSRKVAQKRRFLPNFVQKYNFLGKIFRKSNFLTLHKLNFSPPSAANFFCLGGGGV